MLPPRSRTRNPTRPSGRFARRCEARGRRPPGFASVYRWRVASRRPGPVRPPPLQPAISHPADRRPFFRRYRGGSRCSLPGSAARRCGPGVAGHRRSRRVPRPARRRDLRRPRALRKHRLDSMNLPSPAARRSQLISAHAAIRRAATTAMPSDVRFRLPVMTEFGGSGAAGSGINRPLCPAALAADEGPISGSFLGEHGRDVEVGAVLSWHQGPCRFDPSPQLFPARGVGESWVNIASCWYTRCHGARVSGKAVNA